MPNIEKIARKNKVAQDYIDKISNNEEYFSNIKDIDKSLSVFKKNIEESGLTKQTKEALQDFLVSENIFEGVSDKLFKQNFSAIALISSSGKEKINKAKEIINNSNKTEQEIRKELGLLVDTQNNNTKNNGNKTTNSNKTQDENIDTIVSGSADFDIKKYDKGTVNLVISDLKKQGITNPYMIKAILCTVSKESRFDPSVSEINYNNTSNDRIRKIFGSRVSQLTENELTNLKNNPEAFRDRVYGPDDPTGKSQKYGNTKKGDGLKYRGRGFNGITFKSNYKKYGDMVGEDLVSSPELLNNKDVASKVNAAYYISQLQKNYTKNKYNYDDLNKINSFDTALDIAINVTAGIGKDIDSKNLQYNRNKALQNASNFEFKNVA